MLEVWPSSRPCRPGCGGWHSCRSGRRKDSRPASRCDSSILVLSAPPVVLSVLTSRDMCAGPPRSAGGTLGGGADAARSFWRMAWGVPGRSLAGSGFMVAGSSAGSAVVLPGLGRADGDERARVIGLACVLAGWRRWRSARDGAAPGRTSSRPSAQVHDAGGPALLVAYFAFACYGPGLT